MKEITLDDGMPATMKEVGTETEKLAPYEMIVNGRFFTCQEDSEKSFRAYLEKIEKNEIEVTLFYKVEVQLPYGLRKGKGQKQILKNITGETKSKNFNCTFKTTKDHTWTIFQHKKAMFLNLVELLASAIGKGAYE